MSAVAGNASPSDRRWLRAAALLGPGPRRVVIAAVSALLAGMHRLAPVAMRKLADHIHTLGTDPARHRIDELLARAEPTLSHIDILMLLKKAGSLPEAMLHNYMAALSVARRQDILELVVDHDPLGYPETRFFHALKLQQYRGETAVAPNGIEQAYQRLRNHSLHADAAANLAADALARTGDAGRLASFLNALSVGDLSRLAPATLLGCFRLLETGGQTRIADQLRRTIVDRLPPEQQLYFLAIQPDSGRSLKGAPWRKVLDRFSSVYSAADSTDRQQFAKHVVSPLDALPQGAGDLMNIRFDPDQRAQLQALIAARLRSGEGLGLMRLGDGEGYGYQPPEIAGIDQAKFASDNRIRERMWWGATLDDNHRANIQQQFRAAVAEADVVGVPSVYRIIRDRGTAGTRFGAVGGQRGLAVVLAALGGAVPVTGRILTEERCHQLLFDRASIQALIGLAKRVVVVSCWTREQLKLAGGPELHSIVIPAHTKVAKATGQTTDPVAKTFGLAGSFETHVAEMETLCGPGTLVLVGAGFLGKIFIARAKACQAVALDVGAMLDYLAGFKTRSLADLG